MRIAFQSWKQAAWETKARAPCTLSREGPGTYIHREPLHEADAAQSQSQLQSLAMASTRQMQPERDDFFMRMRCTAHVIH